MEKIAPFILLLMSVLFLFIGLIQKMRGNVASSWPSVSGVMLKSELHEHITQTETSTNRISTFSSYEPLVEYRYSVKGGMLTGNKIAIGLKNLPLEKAQQFLDKYPVGASVPVFYNPKDVKESLLDDAAAGAAPTLILGVVIAAASAVWLVVTLI